jgi:hypothetical protein
VSAGYGVSYPRFFNKDRIGVKLAPHYLLGVNFSSKRALGPSLGVLLDRRDIRVKNAVFQSYYNYLSFEAGIQWQKAHFRLASGGYWGPFIGGKATEDGITFERLRGHRVYDPSKYDFGLWLDFSMPIDQDRFRAFFKSRIGLQEFANTSKHNTFALGLAMKVFDVK